MVAWSLHLQHIDEAGLARLNDTPEELRKAVAQLGYKLFEADLFTVRDKRGYLAALTLAIGAPNGFANNWDALADALGDLSWSNVAGHPADGYVLLLINGGESLGLTAVDHIIAQEILAATVDFWRSQGKPFWVFYN